MSEEKTAGETSKGEDIHAASRKLALRSLESARSGIDALKILERYGFEITAAEVDEITSRIDKMIEKVKRR